MASIYTIRCPKCGFEFSLQDENYKDSFMLFLLAD